MLAGGRREATNEYLMHGEMKLKVGSRMKDGVSYNFSLLKREVLFKIICTWEFNQEMK